MRIEVRVHTLISVSAGSIAAGKAACTGVDNTCTGRWSSVWLGAATAGLVVSSCSFPVAYLLAVASFSGLESTQPIRTGATESVPHALRIVFGFALHTNFVWLGFGAVWMRWAGSIQQQSSMHPF